VPWDAELTEIESEDEMDLSADDVQFALELADAIEDQGNGSDAWQLRNEVQASLGTSGYDLANGCGRRRRSR
jgi:hypothetical protein